MTDPFTTPAALRQWLSEHKPYETVGFRNDTYEDVVARFLRSQGHDHPVVGTEQWWCDCHAGQFDMPGWLYRFVQALDRETVEIGRQHGPVTQAEAMDALAFIESGLGVAGLGDGLVAGAPASADRAAL